MQSGLPCTIPSSRAQISGTSPSPSARAAVAGNSAVMSSVAVKMMLTRSSWATPLRSSISCTSRLVLVSTSALRVVVARLSRRAAPGLSRATRLTAAIFGFADCGGVQRPHLERREHPPLRRRERPVAERPDARAHETVHRMTRPRDTCGAPCACDLPSPRSRRAIAARRSPPAPRAHARAGSARRRARRPRATGGPRRPSGRRRPRPGTPSRRRGSGASAAARGRRRS